MLAHSFDRCYVATFILPSIKDFKFSKLHYMIVHVHIYKRKMDALLKIRNTC